MTKYFRAKFDHWVRENINQLKMTNRELETAAAYHAVQDEKTRARAELMYSYYDYDNDRARVRNRFFTE